MVRTVVMPKLGQSEEEAKLILWRKQEGDAVSKGDVLFEIETDKAALEVESFFDGTLLKIVVREGETVPVHSPVAYIGNEGEAVPRAPLGPPREPQSKSAAAAEPHAGSVVQEGAAAKPPLKPRSVPQPPAATASAISAANPLAPEVLRISPRARKLARESAIDPSGIEGTGPGGRVVERDVIEYLQSNAYDRLAITPAAKKLAIQLGVDLLKVPSRRAGHVTVEDIVMTLAEQPKPLTRTRQVIAERLTRSVTTAPHFFVTVAVDMSDLVALRAELKEQGRAFTITDFIMAAVTLSLKEFPVVNSTTDGKSSWWHSKVHLGLAVNLPDGLVVPVIRNADDLSLEEIHERSSRLIARARAGKLTPDEMTGSTFTISNLGMMNVENFTAIINPGESAILAVSSVLKQPVARNDQVVGRDMMRITLSSDHRIVDGATAAQFVNAVKTRLEAISLWKRMT